MSTRRGEAALGAAIVAVFLLVRLTLLVVREPFFDELFTVWMAGRPLQRLFPALLLDSGPPLYYLIARIPDVTALRVLSLLFATVTLGILLLRPALGPLRFVAGALLAVYPPAALFAVDARAYALCALFVTAGVLALDSDRPLGAAGAFLLAAYSHWYGALFLPLLLLPLVRSKGPRLRALLGLAGASLLFVPGLLLAIRQPAEATEWLAEQSALAPLGTFSFAGRYADALFAPAPLALVGISTIALLLAAGRSWRFAPAVIVPVVLALLIAAGGRTVYFPMRFESVVAVPLMLWLADSLRRWRPLTGGLLLSTLLASGAAATALGVSEHATRPLDDYREAAVALRQHARPGDVVVATGFLYLESMAQLGEERVRAWPTEQGSHPGWRSLHAVSEEPPAGSFVWVGERAAPELELLRRKRRISLLFGNERALILRVESNPVAPLTAALH